MTDLGGAVRELTHAVVDTEVDDAVLAEAADLARRATELLATVTRPAHHLSATEDLRLGRNLLSPVSGEASPVSPPVVTVRVDAEELRVEATATLHRVHEGPPTYGHGGMSAMILDQALGHAVALTGRIGLTHSLTVRYRRPVPLGVPLAVTAWVTQQQEVVVQAHGVIASAAAPDVVLVEADGGFVVPSRDQASRLFGHVERPGSR